MRNILLIFIALATNLSFSQSNSNKDPIDAILNNGYFNNYSLENFYLHTNKSVYFTQEEIFFKAYVVHEENNKPFLETTNLHINIYDSENKLVISELFYVDKGITYGTIAIPEDIKTGNYTIQLNTQWNRNFKEGSLFPIQIYNIKDTTTSITKPQKRILNQEDRTAFINVKKTGYILEENKLDKKDIVSFRLNTDNKTVLAEKDKFIYAVLHKKGVAKSVAPIKLIKGINTYKLNFYKNSLYEGTNTISVFNKQNEILAQINYYKYPEKKVDIITNVLKETKDSVSLNIKLLNSLKDTNISVAVLHQQTKAIDSNATITKTLLGIDTKNAFPYKDKTNTKPLFTRENGLKITGTVNSSIENTKNHKVMLTSHVNNILLTSPITSDKKFEFKNLLLKHPSDYKLALVNKKGEIIKGEFYVYKDFVTYKADNILNNYTVIDPIISETLDAEKEINLDSTVINSNTNEIVNYFPLNNEIEELEEVFLKDIQNKKQQRVKELKKENKFLGIGAGFSKDYIIDTEKDSHLTLKDYLINIPGLRVTDQFGVIKVYTRRMSNLQKSAGASLMNIILDGMPFSQEDGLDIAYLNVTDFELISVNISGAGYGINGSNGVINLITRNDFSYKNKGNSFTKEYQTVKGFNLNQAQLEDSKLTFPSLQSQYYYKTIDWIPNYNIKANSSNILKIKKPKHEKVKLIINGFNENGNLISKIIEL
ncbi:hypothetical protein [Lacinutrix cladophorae]